VEKEGDKKKGDASANKNSKPKPPDDYNLDGVARYTSKR